MYYLRKLSIPFSLLFTILFLTNCNKCSDVECQNGGTCNDGYCDCAIGFSGPECNLEERAQYLGTFTAEGNCTSQGQSYIIIERNSTRGDKITIQNLDDRGVDVTAEANKEKFIFEEQTFLDGTILGEGAWEEGKLKVTYTVHRPSGSYHCSFDGTKS